MKKNTSYILLTLAILISSDSLLGMANFKIPCHTIIPFNMTHMRLAYIKATPLRTRVEAFRRKTEALRKQKLNNPKFTLATLKEQTKHYVQNYGLATTAAIIGTTLGLYSNKLPNLDYCQLTDALPKSPMALKLYTIAPWVTVIWGIGTNEIALEQKEIQAQESYKHNPASRQATINSLKFASCAFLALGTYTIAKNLITQN